MSSRIWMPSDAFAASGMISAVSAIQVEKLINATSNQTDQRFASAPSVASRPPLSPRAPAASPAKKYTA